MGMMISLSIGFILILCLFGRIIVVSSLLGAMISLAIGSWPDNGFRYFRYGFHFILWNGP